MQYLNRDIADEDDIEELRETIDAILDILHMKGIIREDIDHWNVVEYRNELNQEVEQITKC